MSKRTWTWRHAILESDLPAITRHVLLTIGCYMNDVGGGCYPTVEALVTATGLSDRGVRKHIAIAREAGWLIVREHGFRGQKWRNHEYIAAWPEAKAEAAQKPQAQTEIEAESSGTGAEQTEEGAAPRAAPSRTKVRHLVPEGAAPRAKKVRHQVPLILPVDSSNILPKARERVGGKDFSDFWEGWPSDHRPDNRPHAEKLFLALSPAERLIAAGCAKVYRRTMALRRDKPRMIPFLKDRLFGDFHDGPPIDSDGDFVIKPGRPEWREWLDDLRNTHGEDGVQYAIRSGLMVRKNRWPPGHKTGRLTCAEAAE